MDLILALNELLATREKCGATKIIAIDGRAGSGKTTLAADLTLALSLENSVTLVHMDEIYEGWAAALGPSLTATLERLLEALSRKEPYALPIYDWGKGVFLTSRTIAPTQMLILDGVGSAQAKVREYAAATIWLDIEAEIGLERVLQRDGQGIVNEMRQWQRDEENHFALDKTREYSDFILSTSEADSAPYAY